MVFQHSRPLNRQTVLENIMVALLPDSLFMLFVDKALTERAKWIANRVGLGAVMDRRPPTLPFADLRRLELAKAIARDPKVVLVDEPFAGLTLAEVGTFSELIRSFRDEGRAVLLVDHNVKSVAALVDRVLAMYLGEEIVTGRADEVMRNETGRSEEDDVMADPIGPSCRTLRHGPAAQGRQRSRGVNHRVADHRCRRSHHRRIERSPATSRIAGGWNGCAPTWSSASAWSRRP